MRSINKAVSFFARDWRIESSYRLSFIMSLGGIFISVAVFFFISKLFGSSVSPYLAEFGGDYFAYVLVGIAFTGLASTGMSTFASTIAREQADGTLEAMLVAPTRLSAIILYSSFWNFFLNIFNVMVYLTVGNLFFGLSLARINILSAFVVLLLTTLTFSGIGVISASFIVAFKRGNPIDALYKLSAGLLGGMYFPVQVLPGWLQPLVYIIPLFHALRAMRLSVLKGYSIFQLQNEIGALVLFAAALLPLGNAAFKYAVREAKKDGSLVTY